MLFLSLTQVTELLKRLCCCLSVVSEVMSQSIVHNVKKEKYKEGKIETLL